MTLGRTTEIARLIDTWALQAEGPQHDLYRVLVDDPDNEHVLLLYLVGKGTSTSCATLQVVSRDPGVNIRSSHLRRVAIDLDVVEEAIANGGTYRRPLKEADARWRQDQRALRDDGTDPVTNLWSLVKPRPHVQRRPVLKARLPLEHFQEVARLYDEAVRLGTPTADHIAKNMGYEDRDKPLIRVWISRARNEFSLLPPTKRGQRLGNVKTPEPGPREVLVRDPQPPPSR